MEFRPSKEVNEKLQMHSFTVIGLCGEILRTFRNQITTEPKPGYIGEPFYLTASVTFALYSLVKFSLGNK